MYLNIYSKKSIAICTGVSTGINAASFLWQELLTLGRNVGRMPSILKHMQNAN